MPAVSVADVGVVPQTTRKVVLEKIEAGYRWKLIEAPVPAFGSRQALVRVRAVALNRGDLEMLAPSPGTDLSGLVVASDAAATLPTAGLTAWNAVMANGAVRRDDVVLVQGTGGVSTFALQFAAAAGAKVLVTSSSDDKIARARALGAADGINYRTTPEWSKRVLELTGGHGADVIVDVGGKATLAQSAQSLAYGGTLSLVGGLTGYDGQVPAVILITKHARAQGIYVGSRADYLRMSAFIVTHGLEPVIEREFPLARFEEALKLLESGRFVGKIVLTL